MQYLIFLDIDGTILDNHTYISPRTIAGIRRAQALGHAVFLNTGRSAGILPQDVLDAVRPDGIVGGLGAWISYHGELLLADVVPLPLLKFALSVSVKYHNPVFFEGETLCIAFRGEGWWGAEMTTDREDVLWARLGDHPRISKMTFQYRLPDAAVAELSEHFSVFNHPTYAEVGLPGYSKASGMDLLREKLGVDRDHVIAMGDSDNDAEMLRAAGIAVVMANATPTVLPLADFVSLSCREGGVGYAIEALIPGCGPGEENQTEVPL